MMTATRVLRCAALFGLCLVLAAGCSKSTTTSGGGTGTGTGTGGGGALKENFEKIKPGMSEDEVKKTMGSDGKKADLTGMPGVSGKVYSLTWEEGNKMYIVSFKDDKVADKKADNK